jgi:hypothetical protein
MVNGEWLRFMAGFLPGGVANTPNEGILNFTIVQSFFASFKNFKLHPGFFCYKK